LRKNEEEEWKEKDNAETQRAQSLGLEEKTKSTGRSACATRMEREPR
jgi:hypothetical protein